MINRMPRKGYGYGIIRVSHTLTRDIVPLSQIKRTDVQGELQERGTFEQVKQALLLPDDYTIMGIYMEAMRFTWCILVEAPDIPHPELGCELPVLTPIYQQDWNEQSEKYQSSLLRVDISNNDHNIVRFPE